MLVIVGISDSQSTKVETSCILADINFINPYQTTTQNTKQHYQQTPNNHQHQHQHQHYQNIHTNTNADTQHTRTTKHNNKTKTVNKRTNGRESAAKGDLLWDQMLFFQYNKDRVIQSTSCLVKNSVDVAL
jgi:hypothetical protein